MVSISGNVLRALGTSNPPKVKQKDLKMDLNKLPQKILYSLSKLSDQIKQDKKAHSGTTFEKTINSFSKKMNKTTNHRLNEFKRLLEQYEVSCLNQQLTKTETDPVSIIISNLNIFLMQSKVNVPVSESPDQQNLVNIQAIKQETITTMMDMLELDDTFRAVVESINSAGAAEDLASNSVSTNPIAVSDAAEDLTFHSLSVSAESPNSSSTTTSAHHIATTLEVESANARNNSSSTSGTTYAHIAGGAFGEANGRVFVPTIEQLQMSLNKTK